MVSGAPARPSASCPLIFACLSAARAETSEEFYKGKTATLIVGYSAGGGVDIYARCFAKFYRNHFPGNPNVLVQNMPSAGSLTATNYINNVASKDGTVLALARAPVMELLAGTPSSAFDAQRLSWIGNGATELTVCSILNNANVRTMSDAQRTSFTLAGLGPGSDDDMFTKVLNRLIGMKARLVNGYPAGAEAMLAVERGEIDGRCAWSYSTLQKSRQEWISEKRGPFLASLTMIRSPQLPQTPSVMEFMTTKRQRQIMQLVIGSQIMGRPIFASPGVPSERLRAIQSAFEKTMKDPDFVADRAMRMKKLIQALRRKWRLYLEIYPLRQRSQWRKQNRLSPVNEPNHLTQPDRV